MKFKLVISVNGLPRVLYFATIEAAKEAAKVWLKEYEDAKINLFAIREVYVETIQGEMK